jgi:UDP-3-O-[3-hydroxymyristoyl] glucosamine N-acyltransferase
MAEAARFTLGRLAEALDARLDRDPERIVTGVAPLESAGPGHISFLADSRYCAAARRSRAGAFLAPADVSDLPAPALRCREPREALIDLLTLFYPSAAVVPGVDASAVVAPDAQVHPSASIGALTVIESGAVIGPNVRLHPLVYIGARVEVGEASVLYPHVVVREGIRLGRRVIIHGGAVIGADGFGYVFQGSTHRKIPQVGGVIIEDDVEIGANATIDRATLGDTLIRRGTKIDNLVQVGHNVEIGEHAILVAQVGVSGSCRLGTQVVLAGQVGVADHVTIGDGVIVGAQSGVANNLKAGETYFGYPARPAAEARRINAALSRLPELLKKFRALERRVRDLEGRSGFARPTGHDDAA